MSRRDKRKDGANGSRVSKGEARQRALADALRKNLRRRKARKPPRTDEKDDKDER